MMPSNPNKDGTPVSVGGDLPQDARRQCRRPSNFDGIGITTKPTTAGWCRSSEGTTQTMMNAQLRSADPTVQSAVCKKGGVS